MYINQCIVVKKGDPPLELPTLKVPTSTSEVWDLISSFGKSKPSVTDPDAKEEKVTDKCAIADEVKAEVILNDPAAVVSDLHSQCHCPIGECLQNPGSNSSHSDIQRVSNEMQQVN